MAKKFENKPEEINEDLEIFEVVYFWHASQKEGSLLVVAFDIEEVPSVWKALFDKEGEGNGEIRSITWKGHAVMRRGIF